MTKSQLSMNIALVIRDWLVVWYNDNRNDWALRAPGCGHLFDEQADGFYCRDMVDYCVIIISNDDYDMINLKVYGDYVQVFGQFQSIRFHANPHLTQIHLADPTFFDKLQCLCDDIINFLIT